MLNADSNQYFITTHSPYVINEFLENKADVAIFLTDYVDGETRLFTALKEAKGPKVSQRMAGGQEELKTLTITLTLTGWTTR